MAGPLPIKYGASIIFKTKPQYFRQRSVRSEIPKRHSKYDLRDKRLFKMGFASYRDYLHSSAWKAIRGAKLAVCPRCEICGDKAQCVHHQSYNKKTLVGLNEKGLVSLCNSCHKKAEFGPDGKMRGFERTKRWVKKKVRRRKSRVSGKTAPVGGEP